MASARLLRRPSGAGCVCVCARARGRRAGRGEKRARAGSRARAPSRLVLARGCPAPPLPRELRTGSRLTQQPAPAPLSARAGGGLQSAGDMSGGGDDVVCTGWLRKSPPEKKLRRYVSEASGRGPAGGRPGAPAASELGGSERGRARPLKAPRPRRATAAGREWGASHLSQVRRRGAGRAQVRAAARRPPPRELPEVPKFVAIVPGDQESKRPGLMGPHHPGREDRLRGRAAPGPQRARRRAPLRVPFSVRPSPVAAGFLPVRGHCITGSVSGMCSACIK